MRVGLLVLGLLVGCGDDGGGDTSGTSTSSTTGTTGTGTGTSATGTGTTGTSTGTTGTTSTASTVTIEVGNGFEEHVAITDGSHVEMFFGVQGGWHIDMSGVIGGTTANVAVSFAVTHVSTGDLLAGGADEYFLLLAGWDIVDQSGLFFGQRAGFVNTDGWLANNTICQYENQELDICIHVEDLSDRSLRGDECVRIIADLHPADVQRCSATP